jgi:XTP/dITP diphosphohydrolase
MHEIVVATSNPGKLRDFAGAAARHKAELKPLPGFANLPAATEDGATFEENARKKAEHYSRLAPGKVIIADDSGLEVLALNGEPGIRSARYAARPGAHDNADDIANNALLLANLADRSDRRARFVCVIAAAKNGTVLRAFRGEAEGVIAHQPRGHLGFGYDPLFYFPGLNKTFGELTPEEKAMVSHRGRALEKFLSWYEELHQN